MVIYPKFHENRYVIPGLKKKIFSYVIFVNLLFSFRLVNSDVVFYSTSLNKLTGFKDLNNNCDGLWAAINELKTRQKEHSRTTAKKTTTKTVTITKTKR